MNRKLADVITVNEENYICSRVLSAKEVTDFGEPMPAAIRIPPTAEQYRAYCKLVGRECRAEDWESIHNHGWPENEN